MNNIEGFIMPLGTTKMIVVNNCGECPYAYFEASGNMVTECTQQKDGDCFVKVDRNSIDKNCPLENKPAEYLRQRF